MRKIKFTVALIFLLSSLAFAQDTLVKTNGDSLVGRLSFGIDSFQKEYVTVKVNRKKNRVKLLEIRSITLANGDYIKPVGFGGSYKLGKQIESGFLTYYKVSDPKSSEKFTADLLFKMDGNYALFEGKIGFKTRTRELLGDCAIVAQAVNDKKYKRNDMQRLTRDYNKCLEANKGFTSQASQPITTASATQNQLSKNLEQKISDFTTLLEYSDKVSNKSDVVAMFNDVSGKLRRKEAVPSYLNKALTDALKTDPQLTKLIKEILASK